MPPFALPPLPPPPGFPAKKNAATAGEPATSNKRALTGYDSDSDGDEGVKRRRDLLATPAEMPLGRTGTVLDLDEAVGKVQIVDKGGLTGFRCDLCEMSFLDSTSYLNHIDGPNHLRRMGFGMRMARATVESVRAKFAEIKERKDAERRAKGQVIDYEAIFAAAREKAEAEKRAKKEQRAKRKKQRKEAAAEAPLETKAGDEDPMAALMGFSSFKSGAPKAK